MIAQASVENHVARRGESAHGLFHGDRFLEGKQRAGLIQILADSAAPHDDQRNRSRLSFHALQFAQELRAAIQIAVHDEGVDL